MIAWYIIGIIMFVLQVYILKHTYSVDIQGRGYDDNFEESLQPIKTPMFVIILMALLTIIPYAWIISTLAFWTVWIKKYSDPEDGFYSYSYRKYTYWRLRDNLFMRTI